MIDKINEGMLELKSFVSHSEVDSYLRDQTIIVLSHVKESIPEVQICQQYIVQMEDTHEKLLEKISVFIDTFSCHFADFHSNFQTIQQDLEESNKVHADQKIENQNFLQEMSKRIEQLNKEIFSKEEEARQLSTKLQERETQIDTLERESNEYLKKMQADFYRNQKALEDSYEIITKLEQEMANIKNQNEHLTDLNSLLQKSRIKGSFNKAIIEEDRLIMDIQSEEVNRSHHSPSFVRSSLISSNSQQGLSQFQQLIPIDIDSREVLTSIQGLEMPIKTETLRQMLNMSVQKEYLVQYNKCESIEKRFLQKQNYCVNDYHFSKSKQQMWMINNSLDFAPQKTIKEFNIVPQQDSKKCNPYYSYFLITSQNAKINSNYFEKVYHISTDEQWKKVNDLHLPLHEWESYLKDYLLRQAKIIS